MKRIDTSLAAFDRRSEFLKEAFTTRRERNNSFFQKVSELKDLLLTCEEENQRLRNLLCHWVSQELKNVLPESQASLDTA